MDSVINALKYGPGSPGETSLTIVKMFAEICEINPEISYFEALKKLYLYRKMADNQMADYLSSNDGNYEQIEFEKVLELSTGCFALFIFTLMCVDSKRFINNVGADSVLMYIVADIIYEIVSDNARSRILLSNDEYQEKCKKVHFFLKRNLIQ